MDPSLPLEMMSRLIKAAVGLISRGHSLDGPSMKFVNEVLSKLHPFRLLGLYERVWHSPRTDLVENEIVKENFVAAAMRDPNILHFLIHR